MRTRELFALGVAAAAALCAVASACGGSSTSQTGNGADAGQDAGPQCTGVLAGLLALPDGGGVATVTLTDAGFTCIALLLVDDAGVTNTLSITPTDLPDGVIALSTVLVRAGDPPFGATPDSGTQFALTDFTQASSSVGLVDGRSFALQKATGQPTTGKAALVYTYVNDAGTSAAEGKRYEAHGTLDATLPYVFGSQPDGGTFDAGRTVLLHAEF